MRMTPARSRRSVDPSRRRDLIESLETRRLLATLTTLVHFNGITGEFPRGGLIADGDFNLYGTTEQGGGLDAGTAFKVDVDAPARTTIGTLDTANGQGPYAGLVADAAGNFYGTAIDGGANGVGSLFMIAAGTTAVTRLASFNGANGDAPRGKLLLGADGNLYGTTAAGGAGGAGTVFKFDTDTDELTAIVSFNGTNGRTPFAGLIADSAGNLYGTTSSGGAGNKGTVFKVAAGSNALTTLVSFNGTNGMTPGGGLLMLLGELYGTTQYGGANNLGTVFKVAADTNALTTLVSFAGSNGSQPFASLIADDKRNLYGTTQYGGASDKGTVFKVAVNTNVLTTLATFNGGNGQAPRGELIADGVGNLYGTTFNGGAANDGTVFKITETTYSVPTPLRPEAEVRGNEVAIVDGDSTPAAADFTDFGTVAVGSTFTRTFKVANINPGKIPLTTSALSVPAGFTVTEGLAATIALGASDTFTVRLNATAAGTFAGQITFANNDNNENPYNFAIRGVVVPAFASIAGRVLSVPGTAGNDNVGFSVSGATVTVRLGSAIQTVALADFDKVEVQAGNGDDRVDLGNLNKPAYLSGGSGADTLVGGESNDTLLGGGGGDRLYGRGGNDRVSGSGSRDFCYGEAGDDRVYGDEGNDHVDGGGNKDRAYGGDGDDSVIGGGSVDRLYGDAGRDTLYGNDSNDYLGGGADPDTLFGGAGNDVNLAFDASDLVDSVEVVA